MTGRRKRKPRLTDAKPGEIKVAYGEPYPGAGLGLAYSYGAYGAYKGHTAALMDAFEKLVIEDGLTLAGYLKREGFDLTTLKFSVRKADPRARDGSLPPSRGG